MKDFTKEDLEEIDNKLEQLKKKLDKLLAVVEGK